MSDYITTKTDSHTVVSLPFTVNERKQWVLSKLAFKKRFPPSKWLAARVASNTDVVLFDFFEDFDLAKSIDLKDSRTINSVNLLGNESIPVEYRLTENEISDVLDRDVDPQEAP